MTLTMKHICRTIAAPAILAAAVSCSFLERAPRTQTSPENFFQDEAQFKLALTGAYETMNASSIGGVSVGGGTYNVGLLYIMTGPSDEAVAHQNAADTYGACTDFLKASFTQATSGLRRFWIAFYAGIDRCNSIISHIDNLGGPDAVLYVAEARFLRGFYYWYLAQSFGAVPLVGYHSDGQEPRSPLKDVYDYILEDLQFAADNLPSSGGILGRASANKYTAEAYIARICNYLAACRRFGTGQDLVSAQPLNDFSWVDADAMSVRAKNACKDIIDNSQYELVKDWTDLFRETTKAAQHRECLFMAENYISGSENQYPVTTAFGFSPSGTADTAKGNAPSVWSGYVWPTVLMFQMYSPKDPRRDWFFTSYMGGDVNAGTIVTEVREGISYPRPWYRPSNWSSDSNHDGVNQTFLPFLNGSSNMSCGKYRFAQVGQIPEHTTGVHSLSLPLMRMADVYLMYGEAVYFADGDEDLARAQFRTVLERACRLHWNGTDPEFDFHDDTALVDELMAAYRRDDFIEELLETRERELCFEGSRKWDLVRFNRIDECIGLLTGGSPDGDPVAHPYDRYMKRFDGKVVAYNASNTRAGIDALRTGWTPFKIWLPISDLERAANKNLTQNAQW